MRDFLGRVILPGDHLIYVMLQGGKPLLTKAQACEVEINRVKVRPLWRIGWVKPEEGHPAQCIWLNQPENIALMR